MVEVLNAGKPPEGEEMEKDIYALLFFLPSPGGRVLAFHCPAYRQEALRGVGSGSG